MWMLLFSMRAILKFCIEWIFQNLCNPQDIESEIAVIVTSRAYGIQNKYNSVKEVLHRYQKNHRLLRNITWAVLKGWYNETHLITKVEIFFLLVAIHFLKYKVEILIKYKNWWLSIMPLFSLFFFPYFGILNQTFAETSQEQRTKLTKFVCIKFAQYWNEC